MEGGGAFAKSTRSAAKPASDFRAWPGALAYLSRPATLPSSPSHLALAHSRSPSLLNTYTHTHTPTPHVARPSPVARRRLSTDSSPSLSSRLRCAPLSCLLSVSTASIRSVPPAYRISAASRNGLSAKAPPQFCTQFLPPRFCAPSSRSRFLRPLRLFCSSSPSTDAPVFTPAIDFPRPYIVSRPRRNTSKVSFRF